jgi:hypothetical protein
VHKVTADSSEDSNRKDVFAVRKGSNSPQNHGDRQQRWTATVKVDSVPIFWKLEPGADVTVIPLDLFKKKVRNQQLRGAELNLHGPSGERMKTAGAFKSILKTSRKSIEETVYVVDGLERPLLGI